MIAALLLTALNMTQPAAATVSDSFPHVAHRRLFTTCRLCHAGIVTGDSAQSRPAGPSCASCHDGRTERVVEWAPREARPSNLRFDHRRHFAVAPDTSANERSCRGCHATGAGTAFMDVARASPGKCLDCHAHRAPEHLATANRCATCHVPLPEATRLAAATIARFPKPVTHDSAFVLNHAEPAQDGRTCQVCHSRDFCASCHVNAPRLAPIQSLGSDARVAQLMRDKAVKYPKPATHEAADFTRRHGLLARTGAPRCANCHARESCLTCHTQAPLVPIVAALPLRSHEGAFGVDLSELRPPGHLPDFRTNHGAVAAGGDAACSRCHRQTWCASCHDGPRRPGFHAVNFVMRHASPALNTASECATCHQVQAFCTDCHRQNRMVPAAPSGAAANFHNAQPDWLFGHGGAARRSLESCVACHQQSFCMQCHSSSRGWKVNPHGPGFRPEMGERTAAMCRMCHTQGPPVR